MLWRWLKSWVYGRYMDGEWVGGDLRVVSDRRIRRLERRERSYGRIHSVISGDCEERVNLLGAPGYIVPLSVRERKDEEEKQALQRLEAEKKALEAGCAKLTNDLMAARADRDRIQRILKQYRAVEVDTYRASDVILRSNLDHYKEKAEKLQKEVEQLSYDGEECD